jgi:hypothetical protein
MAGILIKMDRKMETGFLLRSSLIILIVASGCSGPDTQDDQTDSSKSVVDTPLHAQADSISTLLPDESSFATAPDTNGPRKYYGEDYDGDTILYEENGKVLTQGIVTGTFVEIQRGDYLHLILQDEQGWYHSFWILNGESKLMDEYWEGKQPNEGQKIRVHWIRMREYMYEARSEMVIYKMTQLETLDN